mmetsp:Transcript_20447/g.18057  ORF Transcript_20447/g.18057 Transcript_20447/m.18057 type:complete len:86 (+) Transcript_20447:60-317(+)|eukprot:CAMPEP_0201587888 /NCGR_PEP_ID=MMETSP0190_2-20130828/148748_1 /ASSEMBLY_ACC=CAM_ASM_000263 /TAXON_ID=37353 /ORGANISM="Rosalina sp." /LENGTH=85 /DNA_ID=CAMNT_0048038871 /DNA_START=56 /DNA_END=313 /DNA_ORIENTATION=-
MSKKKVNPYSYQGFESIESNNGQQPVDPYSSPKDNLPPPSEKNTYGDDGSGDDGSNGNESGDDASKGYESGNDGSKDNETDYDSD